jgi:hypothetical protein
VIILNLNCDALLFWSYEKGNTGSLFYMTTIVCHFPPPLRLRLAGRLGGYVNALNE